MAKTDPKLTLRSDATTGASLEPPIVRPDDAPHHLLDLHTQAGNQAVSQLVQPGAAPTIQRQCKACSDSGHQCAQCQKEEQQTIQRQANSPGAAAPSAIPAPVQAALTQSGGQTLPGTVRAGLEQQFNRDFGQVRVHTDPTAAQAAQAIDAAAFTYGQSIWFGSGRFQPETKAGLHLLSHELAHTVQQGAHPGPVQPQSLTVGKVNDPLEAAADHAANAILNHSSVSLGSTSGPVLRRAPRVSPVKDKPNERYVDLDNGDRYRVIRNIKMIPHQEEYPSGGEPRLRGRVDKNNIWLQVDWCKNSTRGEIKVGLDLPSQAQTLLRQWGQAILQGQDPVEVLKNAELTPFASVVIAQSQRFTLSAEAKTTIEPATGDVKGGSLAAKLKLPNLDLSLEGQVNAPPTGSNRQGPDWQVTGNVVIPLEKPGKVKCPTKVRTILVPQISYQCVKEVETGTRMVPHISTAFLYFKYAEDIFENNVNAPGGGRNPAEMTKLEQLLTDGYQVTGIRGFASPEGPQKAKGNFIGNIALSQKRADATKAWIEQKCKPSLLQMRQKPLNCFAGDLLPSGEGELYTKTKLVQGEEKEVEGRPQAEHAVEQFKTDPDEERHRTPETEEELKKREKSPEKQAKDVVYPLLRRAEITLRKDVETPFREAVPAERQKTEECTTEVIKAVEADFEKSQPLAPLKP